MGSNPIRATDRVAIARYAVRLWYRTLLCCEGPFSDGRFSDKPRATREAVNGEVERRRSASGRAFALLSLLGN